MRVPAHRHQGPAARALKPLRIQMATGFLQQQGNIQSFACCDLPLQAFFHRLKLEVFACRLAKVSCRSGKHVLRLTQLGQFQVVVVVERPQGVLHDDVERVSEDAFKLDALPRRRLALLLQDQDRVIAYFEDFGA